MLYRIQSTALGQSGNALVILPEASITVLDSAGALARIYADPDEVTELSNPTTADASGGYDFYVAYGDYYDVSVTLNGKTVDERVYTFSLSRLNEAELSASSDASQTALDRIATAADRVQTGLDAASIGSDAAQTALDRVATAADRVQTGLDVTAAGTARDLAETYAGVDYRAATWDELALIGGLTGEVGYVNPDDAGTHTDPITALTVPNEGVYTWAADGLGSAQAERTASTGIAKLIPKADPVPNSDFSILDPDGNFVFSVRGGTTVFINAQMQRLNGYPISEILPIEPLSAGMRSNIEGTLSYGQSNSIGTINEPALSTVARFDNLRFSGGVRSQDSLTPYTSFVPLTEQLSVNGGITYSETPIAGSAEMVFELLSGEDGIAFTDISWQIFGSAPGDGGKTIAQLSDGTIYFDRLVTDVQNAVSLSAAAGKSVKFRSVLWSQGETDQTSGALPAPLYGPRLVQLQKDVETAIQAETGQTEPVALITSQFNSHQNGGATRPPEIVDEIRKACRDNDDMYLAGPWYPFQPATVLHPGVIEYKRIGAMYGIVQKRVLLDGVRWRPVEPLEITQFGNFITIKFNVPEGKLEFDTTLLAAVADMGFTVVDSIGNPIVLDRVDLIGADTVSLACASDPTGGEVRYAWQDGGNLRDSQGDTIIFDGGAGYTDVPMHNWCVIFKEAL